MGDTDQYKNKILRSVWEDCLLPFCVLSSCVSPWEASSPFVVGLRPACSLGASVA